MNSDTTEERAPGGARRRLILAAAAVAFAAGFSVLAQSPTPGPTQTPAAPPEAGRGAQGTADAAAAGQETAAGNRGAQAASRPEDAASSQNADADFGPKDPITARTPADEAKSFILPPGYRMELVVAEPGVINPVAVEFDGNGRMFVVEMRSYMLDADGRDKFAPTSRISRWESTRGDGIYDRHTVFVDGLVLPRMVLPFGSNSILTNETNSNDVLKFTDTDGDGVAERREVFYAGVGHSGNLEHQQSGFLWGLDNWIYSTYNAFRFRWTPSGILKEPTGTNFGQWGLAQDDDGKMWFVEAGGENGPMNFQVPIHYGGFSATGALETDFKVVWPAPGIGDTQGGMPRVRMPIGNLNHFSATTGPQIVRGDRLPADMLGDLLFAEPVGRLIRRAKVVKTEGVTQLRNAHPGSEFLISTDMLFRPVNIKTAPDGTVFVVDMYHGIIQESEWTPAGSYLRAKIEQYQLEKVIGHGRIWRLRFDGTPAVAATAASPARAVLPGIPVDRAQPRMLDETPAQLVAHLNHPNGWWRDTAQQLLVLKHDRSVVPALEAMTRTADTLLGRVHAMWTLEGLDALDPSVVRGALADARPRLRVQALRASETLYKAGDRSFEADYRQLLKDDDPDVVLQAMLTLNVVKAPAATQTIRATVEANKARGVQQIGNMLVTRAAATSTAGAGGRGGVGATPEQRAQIERGRTAYAEVCVACHGDDGRGTPLDGAPAGTIRAPAFEGSARAIGHRDHLIRVLLHGLSGPLDGRTYTEVMIPMGSQSDEWLADVASYVRNSFSNTAPFVTAADVAKVRAATAGRKTSWTATELAAVVPRALEATPTWTATASHNPNQANRGIGTATQGGSWTSGVPQAPGMWFQVELPTSTDLVEVQLDTAAIGGGARGARGGARGAAAPAPQAGFPRTYRVAVSMDGTKWTTVAEGEGAAMTSTASFKQVRAKFVRITQLASVENAPAWIIQRLRLYGPGAGR